MLSCTLNTFPDDDKHHRWENTVIVPPIYPGQFNYLLCNLHFNLLSLCANSLDPAGIWFWHPKDYMSTENYIHSLCPNKDQKGMVLSVCFVFGLTLLRKRCVFFPFILCDSIVHHFAIKLIVQSEFIKASRRVICNISKWHTAPAISNIHRGKTGLAFARFII